MSLTRFTCVSKYVSKYESMYDEPLAQIFSHTDLCQFIGTGVLPDLGG